MLEQQARSNGFQRIVGIDEAGRGPLAGPVVAAACHIPENVFFPGINDSKLLTPLNRASLYHQITSHSELSYGVGIVEVSVIDQINILQATIKAMHQAASKISPPPDYLLVDGLVGLVFLQIPTQKVIKGDQLSQSIAAASIIAKETRDRIMIDYHEKYPEYGFNEHKGYGTEKHRMALEKYGPCPLHRMTFEPLKSLFK